MKIKVKENITLGEARQIQKLYHEGLDKNLEKIFKLIAVDEDGNPLTNQNLDDVLESEILNVIASYIEKKNKMMKSFEARILNS